MSISAKRLDLDQFHELIERKWANRDFEGGYGPVISDIVLDGLDLSGETWESVSFIDVSLRSTNLTALQFVGGYMEGCDLSQARLPYSNLLKSEFVRCEMQGTSFFGADLSRCDITESDLRHSSFERSWLGVATFGEVDLRSANFDGCVLERTIFHDALVDDVSCAGARGIIAPWSIGAEARVGNVALSFQEFLQVWNGFPGATVKGFAKEDPEDPTARSLFWGQREAFLRAAREDSGLREDLWP